MHSAAIPAWDSRLEPTVHWRGCILLNQRHRALWRDTVCPCPNGYATVEGVHVAEANAPTEMQQPQHDKRTGNRPAFPLQLITLDLHGMSGASAGLCLELCD